MGPRTAQTIMLSKATRKAHGDPAEIESHCDRHRNARCNLVCSFLSALEMLAPLEFVFITEISCETNHHGMSQLKALWTCNPALFARVLILKESLRWLPGYLHAPFR